MRAKMEALFRDFGQDVQRLREEESEKWNAFVQPVRQQRQEEEFEHTRLGGVDWRRWLYIGPAEKALERGEELFSGGERYRVRESTAVYFGREVLYRRAILCRAKEAAQ